MMITLGSTWKSKPPMTNLNELNIARSDAGDNPSEHFRCLLAADVKQASQQADGSWVRHHSARKP